MTTVHINDSAMVAAVALGHMIDREFFDYCRKLGIDGCAALAAPLDFVVLAERHRAMRNGRLQ